MRILLNTLLRDNYSFFDPDYPLSLSLSNPGANVDHITESMKRGFRGGTIIDVDKATDIEAPDNVIAIQNSLLRSMGIVRAEKGSENKAESTETAPPKEEDKTEDPKDNKKKNVKKKEGEE